MLDGVSVVVGVESGVSDDDDVDVGVVDDEAFAVVDCCVALVSLLLRGVHMILPELGAVLGSQEDEAGVELLSDPGNIFFSFSFLSGLRMPLTFGTGFNLNELGDRERLTSRSAAKGKTGPSLGTSGVSASGSSECSEPCSG